MQNNIKNSNNEGGFFYLIEIILINYKILLSFIVISILGGLILFNLPSPKKKEQFDANINLLIAESPIFSGVDILNKLNVDLASAYNYENWSNDNQIHSTQLSQGAASKLVVSTKFHNVSVYFENQKYLDAINSYLAYTAKNLTDQITRKHIENKVKVYQDKINSRANIMKTKQYRYSFIENEKKLLINELTMDYEQRFAQIENEISNLKIELEAAVGELEFIDTNIEIEMTNTTDITLRRLNLLNNIKVNNLMIENLKKRRSEIPSVEISLDRKLRELTHEENRLENEIILMQEEIDSARNTMENEISNLNKNVVSLGRASISPSPNMYGETSWVRDAGFKQSSIIVMFLSSAFIGVFLGIFAIYFKEEYLKYKSNK